MFEIMMVDDDQDVGFITRILLERKSNCIQISDYLDPDAALAELRDRMAAGRRGPDLITVDLNMPVASGLQIFHEFRRCSERLDSLPGILTGSINPADKADADRVGVSFFATKPLNLEALTDIAQQTGMFEVTEEDGRILIARRTPRRARSAS